MLRSTALALICLAGPVAAQETQTFSLPQGCTAYATVQMLSCTVSHLFTCTGDPAGYQRRVDLDQNGLVYAGTIDAETQWISSYHPRDGIEDSLDPGAADPASLTTLLATNVDTYDFTTTSPQVGTVRYVGEDRLIGKVVIDGVTLDRTQFHITATGADGAELWRSEGNEFVNVEWRSFLAGVSKVTTPTDSYTTDDTPMQFIFPGQPGFLSSQPKFGCGAVMSSYIAPAAPLLPQGATP